MSMSISNFLGKLVCHGQRFLVYPSAYIDRPRYVNTPHSLDYDDLELVTSDGITLRCYLIRPTAVPASRGSVIMFHGNAMDYGDSISGAKRILRMGYTVLILSYRGYAHSDGSPSEKGLRRDAQAALDYLLAHEELSKKPIILYGRSLGGAVAIDLASRNPSKINALIVENTFTSLPDLVRGWPIIGVFSFICNQKWKSASKLPRIPRSVPILMLSGDHDQVVPRKHMHALWEIAKKRGEAGKSNDEQSDGTPRRDVFKSFAYGTHGDTDVATGYWSTVKTFLDGINAEYRALLSSYAGSTLILYSPD